MLIRPETAKDFDIIGEITHAAFKEMPFGDGTEAGIIEDLRKKNKLTISLVAETNNQVVGHAAFSPVLIDGQDHNWYGLGPVAVWPQYQRQGIGSALINEGIERLQALQAKGCVVLGDPNYYQKFGFKPHQGLTYSHAPAEDFHILFFENTSISGEVSFDPVFG